MLFEVACRVRDCFLVFIQETDGNFRGATVENDVSSDVDVRLQTYSVASQSAIVIVDL